MPNKEMPEGYPLEPKDFEGNILKEKDNVKILHIPDWLIHDLDDESKKNILSCINTIMNIYEFDEYGYAWLETITLDSEDEYKSNSFSMEPQNLLKI
jgi:hypothetical protein